MALQTTQPRKPLWWRALRAILIVFGGLIALAILVGSFLPDPPPRTAPVEATPPTPPARERTPRRVDGGVLVERADFADWPFTAERGLVECRRERTAAASLLVTLDVGTRAFGLNGAAIGFGFPDVRDALLPGKTGADVQPFIALGLPLCEEGGK